MTHFSVSNRDPIVEEFESQCMQALPDHLGLYLTGEPLMYHEPHADHMHIDLFAWAPTAARPLWTVVTSGLSAHPMQVPRGHESYARAELLLTLPPDWPPLHEAQRMHNSQRRRFMWPFEQMLELARLPYLNDTWLGYGHSTRAKRTVYQTYPRSQFSGIFFEEIRSLPPEVRTLRVADEYIHLLGMYTLYPRELTYILESGLCSRHGITEKIDAAGIHEGVFPGRQPVV